MKGDHPQWSSPMLLLGTEVAVIVALVAATFVLQNRKKDFL